MIMVNTITVTLPAISSTVSINVSMAMKLLTIPLLAVNPEHATARTVCKYRGLRPGIVSGHVERRVSEGLLERREVPGDRRQTLLVCTAKAAPIVEEGHRLQKIFAEKLVAGLSEADKEAFKKTMALLSHNLDEIRKNGIK